MLACLVLLLVLAAVNVLTASGTVVAWGGNEAGQSTVPTGLQHVVAISAGEGQSLALRNDGTVQAWGRISNPYYHADPATVPTELTDAVAIAAGYDHSLALKENGTVVAWGKNREGQISADGASGVVAIAAGINHSLALMRDGTVLGFGGYGDYGFGQATVPSQLRHVTAIAAGGYHSLALKDDGTIAAWPAGSEAPIGLSNVIAIAAGHAHNLALKPDGTVVAWGNNSYGQTNVPVGLSNVVAIAAGTWHSLAVRQDGTVVAWGWNEHGQTNVPVNLSNVVAVAAGYKHSLALIGAPPDMVAPQPIGPRLLVGIQEGNFYHRLAALNGVNAYAATGLPTGLSLDPSTGVLSGKPLQAGTFPISVSAGNDAGLALWTLTLFVHAPIPEIIGGLGLVGVGLQTVLNHQIVTLNDVETFTVTGLPPGLSLDPSTGLISGAPAATGDFPVTIVASNRFGTAIGSLTVRVSRLVAWDSAGKQIPVPADLTNVVGIAAGGHGLALNQDGTVIGWPYGWYAEGTAVPSGLSNVVAIAAGSDHSVALKQDGSLGAWGCEGFDWEFGGCYAVQVPPGLSNVVAIAAGGWESLVLKQDGTVLSHFTDSPPPGVNKLMAIAVAPPDPAWGGSATFYGVRQDGTVITWNFGQKRVLEGLSNIVAISASGGHLLGLKQDGTVVAWGGQQYYDWIPGQGLVSWFVRAAIPDGLDNLVAISDGFPSLALKQDGTVTAWSLTGETAPVPSGLTNVIAIATGEGFSLALIGPATDSVPKPVSPRALTATRERDFIYRLAALNGATTFSATGLPAGLTLDAQTGLISGQPLNAGTFSITFSASNAAGTVEWTVTMFVTEPTPVITDGLWLVQTVLGYRFSHRIETQDAEWLQATGLPPGVTLDSITGVISGVPLATGDFVTSIVAGNRFRAVTNTLTVRVSRGPVVAWSHHRSDFEINTVPAGLTNIVAIEANTHSLALKQDGTVVAFGPPWDQYSRTNVPSGLSNVVAISVGGGHNLALRQDGTIAAWGINEYGQCNVPSGVSDVIAISAGGRHSLALRRNGTVAVWGYDDFGRYKMPQGLTGIVAIAAGGSWAGGYINLALKADGTVVGWGDYSSPPSGLTDVIAIAAGVEHSLALRRNGTVVQWGRNTALSGTVPEGLTNVVAIAARWYSNLALKQDGTVVAWGEGSGSLPEGLTGGVIAISVGQGYGLALVRPAPPSAVVHFFPQFLIRSPETNHFIVSPDNVSASVVLDGSQSSDPDNDPLQFLWYADGRAEPLATGVLATNRFSVGAHTVTLMVSDGHLTATNQINFEVITPSAAVGQLMLLVDESDLGSRTKQPLFASLLAARHAFDHGDFNAALNQLSAFQNKVRAQVEPMDAALSEQFIATSQQIIAAMTSP